MVAERDIVSIWDYGVEHFRVQVAQRDAETLTAMMMRLVEFHNQSDVVAERAHRSGRSITAVT